VRYFKKISASISLFYVAFGVLSLCQLDERMFPLVRVGAHFRVSDSENFLVFKSVETVLEAVFFKTFQPFRFYMSECI
jgi:hypothetical protein